MTVCWYTGHMPAKRKVTVYIDEELLRAARVRAARTDRRDSDIAEEALRAYLGFDVLERIWAQNANNGLDDDSAMELAVSELHAMREEREEQRRSRDR